MTELSDCGDGGPDKVPVHEHQQLHRLTIFQKVLSYVISVEGQTEEHLRLVCSTLRSSSVFMWKVVSDILTSLVVVGGKLEVWATTNQLLASLSHGMKFTGIIPALGSIICHHVQLHLRARPSPHCWGEG